MKHPGQLLLHLWASAFCIASVSGSYDNGHHLHPQGIAKRQNPAFDQLRVCQGIISEEQCNNGLVQQTINSFQECNRGSTAQLLVDRCRRNSNGEYCNVVITHLVNVNSAATECTGSQEGCNASCRDLLMLLRDELGCCLNLEFNSTLSPVYSPSVFTPELWSRCNVEPVTEECTPSTVQLASVQGRPCSDSELLERSGMITCTRSLLQPIVDELIGTSGCEPYGQAALEQCAVDESNRACSQRSRQLTTSFAPVLNNCQSSNISTCDTTCTESLQDFASSGGCCVNNFFNGSLAGITSIRYDWFSNEYWSRCGITSPGFCETRLSDDITTQTATTVAKPTNATNGAASMKTSMIHFGLLSFYTLSRFSVCELFLR